MEKWDLNWAWKDDNICIGGGKREQRMWDPGNSRHRGSSWQVAKWRKPGGKICMLRSARSWGCPSRCCVRQWGVSGVSRSGSILRNCMLWYSIPCQAYWGKRKTQLYFDLSSFKILAFCSSGFFFSALILKYCIKTLFILITVVFGTPLNFVTRVSASLASLWSQPCDVFLKVSDENMGIYFIIINYSCKYSLVSRQYLITTIKIKS